MNSFDIAVIQERHDRTEKVGTKAKPAVPNQTAAHHDRGQLLDHIHVLNHVLNRLMVDTLKVAMAGDGE